MTKTRKPLQLDDLTEGDLVTLLCTSDGQRPTEGRPVVKFTGRYGGLVRHSNLFRESVWFYVLWQNEEDEASLVCSRQVWKLRRPVSQTEKPDRPW